MSPLFEKINLKQNKLITFEEMISHPIGREVEAMPGVYTQRLKSRYDVLFFKVIQEEGTIIPDNFHDCIEEIVLESGEILEMITGKILNQYDGMIFKKGQPHRTRALKKSVWYAHLYKDKA